MGIQCYPVSLKEIGVACNHIQMSVVRLWAHRAVILLSFSLLARLLPLSPLALGLWSQRRGRRGPGPCLQWLLPWNLCCSKAEKWGMICLEYLLFSVTPPQILASCWDPLSRTRTPSSPWSPNLTWLHPQVTEGRSHWCSSMHEWFPSDVLAEAPSVKGRGYHRSTWTSEDWSQKQVTAGVVAVLPLWEYISPACLVLHPCFFL